MKIFSDMSLETGTPHKVGFRAVAGNSACKPTFRDILLSGGWSATPGTLSAGETFGFHASLAAKVVTKAALVDKFSEELDASASGY